MPKDKDLFFLGYGGNEMNIFVCKIFQDTPVQVSSDKNCYLFMFINLF